jgi:alkylhydroperoxidase family enzyme
MARIPYPDIDHPDYAPLAERVRRERAGWVGNIHKLIMYSPPVFEGYMHFLTAIRQQAALDGRYRELAILMVAVINGADYEFNAHVPFAVKAGVPQAHLDALKRGEKAPGLSPADLAVLNYAEAMTKTIRVPDEVFAAVRKHFAERELVELSLTVGCYNMVSRFLEAMQVDHDYPTK